MYFFPSYVTYYEESGAIYITSGLRMNTVKLSNPQVLKEFHSIVAQGGCAEINTVLEQFLHEQDLLINQNELRAELQELKDVMNETLLVTMMPTESCNFRCTYCYEDHVPNTMRRQTLDRIHEYIAKQAPDFKRINISWFGGEPTLCKDTVLETAELLKGLQKAYGLEYTSGMTTNGYLLSKSDFLLYYNAGITSYQITLDGWNHDKTRPHVSGKGTLQTILTNLQEISRLPQDEYRFNIILRYNILSNSACDSWYDHLHKLFGEDNRFSILVRAVGNWGGESVNTLDLLKGTDVKAALNTHTAYLKKIGLRGGEENAAPLSQICYASYPHSMVFRADGTIQKCTVALAHPKNCIGYVDLEQGVILDKFAEHRWSGTELHSDCYRCAKVLSCLNMQCPRAQIIDGESVCDYREEPENVVLLKKTLED